MIPKAEIDSSLPTSKYWVDSLVVVELRNRLAIFDTLQSKSSIGLAEKVAAKSAYVREVELVLAK